MKKLNILFIFVILFLLIGSLIKIISGQNDETPGLDDVLGEGASDTADDLSSGDTDFLLTKWKDLIMKNSFVLRLDAFFHKINGAFVFLFAQDYSFSLQMFFIVIIWFLTFFSLLGYAGAFLQNEGYKLIVSLGATIILAWIKIFKVVSLWLVKIIFYKTDSGLFSFFTFLLIFVLLFVYIYINKMLAGKIKKDKEKEQQKLTQIKVETQGKFIEGVKKGSS